MIFISMFLVIAGVSFCAEKEDSTFFKNFKPGMTKEEVIKTAKEDTSITYRSLAESVRTYTFCTTKIGDYDANISFTYDNHEKLYSIDVRFDSFDASKIDPNIIEQVKYFYDIFKLKYGKPSYEKPKSILGNTINMFDFKENYLVFAYKWENNFTLRGIVLTTSKFKYGIGILITDKAMEKVKKDEDDAKEEIQKKKVKDF